LGALSITSTRKFFTTAAAIDAADEELKFVDCKSITGKYSIGRGRDVGETEVEIEARGCVFSSLLRRISYLSIQTTLAQDCLPIYSLRAFFSHNYILHNTWENNCPLLIVIPTY
jgi:hypothetical protein